MTLLSEKRPETDQYERPSVEVLIDRCAGCQECVVRCPTEALTMDVATWTALPVPDRCVGCRQCERTCPFSAIVVSGPVLAGSRTVPDVEVPAEVLGSWVELRPGLSAWDEVLAEASRCLDCPDPTCVRGCPAHNDIPGFLRALRSGDVDAAAAVLAQTSTMPDVCARVCDQQLQCEGACSWSLAGAEPVAIGAVERFVVDRARSLAQPTVASTGGTEQRARGRGLEVVVVGGGPAGLTCAERLADEGAAVTLLERSSRPGGWLVRGIPEFTLPDRVARRLVEDTRRAGVEILTGVSVGIEQVDELLQRYDALVWAAGAADPISPAIPGIDAAGVVDAVSFLQAGFEVLDGTTSPDHPSASSVLPRPGSQVLVLGGGNTAMDVARVARRLGAKALSVDWLARRFAPVRPDELSEAEAEGVDVRFETTLRRLETTDGRVSRAVLVPTRQTSASERPQVLDGPEEVLSVELVVVAMGFRIPGAVTERFGGLVPRQPTAMPERSWSGSGLLAGQPAVERAARTGSLALGREEARRAAVLERDDRTWVIGDALVGPSTVVEAMSHGRSVAGAILDRQPRRPSRPIQPRPAHLLLVVDHIEDERHPLAELMLAAAGRRAAELRVRPVLQVLPEDLEWSDGLVFLRCSLSPLETSPMADALGSWQTRGWRLAGRPAAVLAPRQPGAATTVRGLRALLEALGAHAEGSLLPRSRRARSTFALDVVEHLCRPARPTAAHELLAHLLHEPSEAVDEGELSAALVRLAGPEPTETLDVLRRELVDAIGERRNAERSAVLLRAVNRALALARSAPQP